MLESFFAQVFEESLILIELRPFLSDAEFAILYDTASYVLEVEEGFSDQLLFAGNLSIVFSEHVLDRPHHCYTDAIFTANEIMVFIEHYLRIGIPFGDVDLEEAIAGEELMEFLSHHRTLDDYGVYFFEKLFSIDFVTGSLDLFLHLYNDAMTFKDVFAGEHTLNLPLVLSSGKVALWEILNVIFVDQTLFWGAYD